MFKLTRGCSLGAWVRDDQQGPFDEYEQRLGWRLSNRAVFGSWGHSLGLEAIPPLPSGARPIPVVNLPFSVRPTSRLDDLCRELTAYGAPVIVRFGGEMDRPRAGRMADSAAFRLQWSRVRDYVRERAPLVDFAWCPTGYGLTIGGGYRAVPYWPGADQVDWGAFDVYDMPGRHLRSFSMAAAGPYTWMLEQGVERVCVPETGVARDAYRSDEYRARWISELLDYVRTAATRIRLVSYFDSYPPKEPGNDWRLLPETAAWAAWQHAHDRVYFHARPWIRQPTV